MEILSSVNIISIILFVIVLGFLIFEVYIARKQKLQSTYDDVPNVTINARHIDAAPKKEEQIKPLINEPLVVMNDKKVSRSPFFTPLKEKKNDAKVELVPEIIPEVSIVSYASEKVAASTVKSASIFSAVSKPLLFACIVLFLIFGATLFFMKERTNALTASAKQVVPTSIPKTTIAAPTIKPTSIPSNPVISPTATVTLSIDEETVNPSPTVSSAVVAMISVSPTSIPTIKPTKVPSISPTRTISPTVKLPTAAPTAKVISPTAVALKPVTLPVAGGNSALLSSVATIIAVLLVVVAFAL
jgi:hypothetical protein